MTHEFESTYVGANLDAELRVECLQSNPPKPDGFGVFCRGRVVAVLTEAQVREALRHHDELLQEWRKLNFQPLLGKV